MKLLLLATVAMGLVATPALARDKHHGKHQDRHGYSTQRHHANSRYSSRLDANRNGILDRREYGYRDRDRDGRDDRYEARYRYGRNHCPPGLAKRHNGCVPPGQYARMFRQGQRIPSNYGYYTQYNNIPIQYRNQYNLDPNYRYIYRNDQIYVVDPRTSLVERIIGALVR